MKKIILIVAVVFFTACSTMEVRNDYDEKYNFSDVKLFSVVHHVKKGENTLLNERITNALSSVLKQKGYIKTEEQKSDLMFVYHYSAKDKVDIQTDYQMMGIRRYGFGGGMMATTSTYEYTQGTIIVDALDKNTHNIVWRSVGILEVEYKKTPQERKEYVYKIISKLMESFPSKK